jgi:hypothetical protein
MVFLGILSISAVATLSMLMTMRLNNIRKASILDLLKVQVMGLPFMAILVGFQFYLNSIHK